MKASLVELCFVVNVTNSNIIKKEVIRMNDYDSINNDNSLPETNEPVELGECGGFTYNHDPVKDVLYQTDQVGNRYDE